MGRRIPGSVSESVVDIVVVSFTICLLLIRVFKRVWAWLCGPFWGVALLRILLFSYLFQEMGTSSCGSAKDVSRLRLRTD